LLPAGGKPKFGRNGKQLKTANNQLKIAVLAGGISSERQISIESGRCVVEALHGGGYDVVMSDVGPDNLHVLDDKSIDIFFICLHGRFGEDGQLQRILEDRGLRYTHSDSAACTVAMDKPAAKKCFSAAGISTPAAIEFTDGVNKERLEKQVADSAGKFVIKPVSEGSSIGVQIATGAEEALREARRCRREFGDCMIEQFIAGREITVGILAGRALPILEIRPKVGFYDYHAKYLDDNTEYLFDTITDSALVEGISRDAIKCFECLGCRGVARVDFILADDGRAYALEINTVPGMTKHSCVPKAAAKIGVSMVELCDRVVREALTNGRKAKNVHLTEAATDGCKSKENQILPQGV
jgi:D-alanine-D-alanine ligase